jgi:uncharacterized cupredoxin-like copper-binding protein
MRTRLTIVLGAFAVCTLGLTAWLALATAPAAGQGATRTGAKAAVVTVTIGKPSELAFKLSKSSAVPAGPVTFKVTNKGAIVHDFKVCTSPVATSKANSCVGKVTPRLKTGQTATLTVSLKKTGKYEFLCTVPGHASSGMKGLLGVGVKVTNPTPTPAPAPAPAPAPTPTPAPGAATCANPVTTNVNVNMFDFGFMITPSPAPCGTLVITERNTGSADHNINIAGKAGPVIGGGSSATFSVTLTPGTYSYVCDIPGHDVLGMTGRLTVTG